MGQGMRTLRPSGNPVTEAEIQRLQAYVARAEQGDTFTGEEAADFKDLSERAAAESKGQEWGKELLKLGMFIFAVYALGRLFGAGGDEERT